MRTALFFVFKIVILQPMEPTLNTKNNALVLFEDWLNTYLNFERLPKKDIFWLDTVEFLCRRFDNPQLAVPCIHVAGSKGKGSVSAMISSILEAAGHPTGLYTSPHILSLSERIGRAHSPLPEAVYEAAVREMVTKVDSIIPETLPGQRDLTWFELITVFSFLCFREANVDWAVFETGLGGRLDATNVVQPEAAVLTPIELEHTEYLGSTLEQIAGEKAGIIKQGKPVIVSFQHTGKEAVKDVFRTYADERHAPLFFIEDELENLSYVLPATLADAEKGMNVTIAFKKGFNRPISAHLKLMGKVQAENAALAAFTVKKLLPEISESQIEKGLENAVLPGRFELVRSKSGSLIILDGAHTADSIQNTLETLAAVTDDAHLLFACAKDKNDACMVHQLCESKLFSNITITRPGELKTSDFSHLAATVQSELDTLKGTGYSIPAVHGSIDYAESITQALLQAKTAGKPLLVTGSFYLVAEVKKILAAEQSK